jgi:hypothetical protein
MDGYVSIGQYRISGGSLIDLYVPQIVKDGFDNVKVMLTLTDYNFWQCFDDNGGISITYAINKSLSRLMDITFCFEDDYDKYDSEGNYKGEHILECISVFRYYDKDGVPLFKLDSKSGFPTKNNNCYHTYRKLSTMEKFIKSFNQLI